jgi:hypothetical protein
MISLKTIAAGAAVAGSLGLAALGIGTGVANAGPSPVGSGTEWAQDPGWGHGGPGWNGGGGGRGWNGGGGGRGWNGGGWNGGGPGWGPPPPPPPNYGYGGYNGYDGGYNGYDGGYNGGGCITGPLGLLHFCP